MLNTPFAPWPSFSQEEADAVARVLLSNRVNYWTGQECREFEREFAAACDVPRAVSLTNGTVALELAFRALGIGPGAEVVLGPRTFVASASSIVAVGARPVFADIDPDSGNVTAETIERVLTPRTRAVLCVHLGGWPCEMDAIAALAEQHGLSIVEDCAQAHGARYRGRPVGGLGTVAAWSFCQDKIMTTGGEGGMLTTRDEAIWQTSWSYKDHGKSYAAVYEREHPPGFRWLHETFGTNWRMIEMQAVLGRIQLRRLSDWHGQRASNAATVLAACAQTSALRVPETPSHIDHAWYRAYAYVRPEALGHGWSRDRIVHEINALGVPCFTGSCSEIYLERAFDGDAARPSERLPMARQLSETSLCFLVHPTLTSSEIGKTAETIQTVLKKAQR